MRSTSSRFGLVCIFKTQLTNILLQNLSEFCQLLLKLIRILPTTSTKLIRMLLTTPTKLVRRLPTTPTKLIRILPNTPTKRNLEKYALRECIGLKRKTKEKGVVTLLNLPGLNIYVDWCDEGFKWNTFSLNLMFSI